MNKSQWQKLPQLLSTTAPSSDVDFWTDYAAHRVDVCSAGATRADFARQVRVEEIQGRIEYALRGLPLRPGAQPLHVLVDVVVKRLGSEAPHRRTIRKYIRRRIGEA